MKSFSATEGFSLTKNNKKIKKGTLCQNEKTLEEIERTFPEKL